MLRKKTVWFILTDPLYAFWRAECSGMEGEGLSLSRRGPDGVTVLEDLPVVVLDST